MKARFDQIAVNVKEKKKPTEEDRHHYIGLEHLDSGSLTVSRWGADITPKGEKLLMKKGDVLFGKRRAYQKKVAIAPFDGIFSAHGMVLRPNEEIIDRSFFPLFISSDYFLDAAIALSVGSLSPTINWKDLARLEFTLPPLPKQRELAEVLWAIEDTRTAYQRLEQATEELVKSRFIEMFGDPVTNPMGWETLSWQNVFDTTTGKLDSNAAVEGGQYPFFTCAKEPFAIDSYAFDCEALLLAGNNAAGVYDVKHYSGKFNAYQRTYVLQLKNAKWKCELFKHQLERRLTYLQSQSIGSNTKYLTLGILHRLKFVVPPITLQNQFADFVTQADKSKLVIQETLEKHAAVKAAVMREWLR